MHVPDGFLSGPVNAAGYAVSAATVGIALARANRGLREEQVPLLGVTAAFVFAAQMVNFPVAMGTSGHFLGALLAAVVLGPWNACLVLALVLGIQCLLFADGGLTALGANILNMGVIGGFFAYGVFLGLRAVAGTSRSAYLFSIAVASWFSIVAAACACALELAISGTAPLRWVLPAMAGVHAVVGIGEAAITVATISIVLGTRPDLIYARNTPGQTPIPKEIHS